MIPGPDFSPSPPKRAHRANGKPKGGAKPGAGRPKGALDTKPRAPKLSLDSIRAMRLRLPPNATPEQATLAGDALATMVRVMRGQAGKDAFSRLKAALATREEICGPVTQRHEVGGIEGGTPLIVKIVKYTQGDE